MELDYKYNVTNKNNTFLNFKFVENSKYNSVSKKVTQAECDILKNIVKYVVKNDIKSIHITGYDKSTLSPHHLAIISKMVQMISKKHAVKEIVFDHQVDSRVFLNIFEELAKTKNLKMLKFTGVELINSPNDVLKSIEKIKNTYKNVGVEYSIKDNSKELIFSPFSSNNYAILLFDLLRKYNCNHDLKKASFIYEYFLSNKPTFEMNVSGLDKKQLTKIEDTLTILNGSNQVRELLDDAYNTLSKIKYTACELDKSLDRLNSKTEIVSSVDENNWFTKTQQSICKIDKILERIKKSKDDIFFECKFIDKEYSNIDELKSIFTNINDLWNELKQFDPDDKDFQELSFLVGEEEEDKLIEQLKDIKCDLRSFNKVGEANNEDMTEDCASEDLSWASNELKVNFKETINSKEKEIINSKEKENVNSIEDEFQFSCIDNYKIKDVLNLLNHISEIKSKMNIQMLCIKEFSKYNPKIKEDQKKMLQMVESEKNVILSKLFVDVKKALSVDYQTIMKQYYKNKVNFLNKSKEVTLEVTHELRDTKTINQLKQIFYQNAINAGFKEYLKYEKEFLENK